MPHWNDLWNRANRPMVPKGAIAGLREALAPGSSYDGMDAEPDSDADDWGQIPGALADLLGSGLENPLETAGGFASGALEGLRGLTTPLNAALTAAPMGLGYVGRAARPLAKMASPTIDVLEAAPVRQALPAMDEVNAVIGDARRMMAKVPNATGRYRGPGAPPATRNMPPEFTPRGGESAYNVARPGPPTPSRHRRYIPLPPQLQSSQSR